MKWSDPDILLTLRPCSLDQPLPSHWSNRTTLRELFATRLDIFSVPRRSFFEWLAYFTSDELETEKLQEFASSEGQEELWAYANRPKRTIAEVLSEFKSAVIPLDYLADVFPEIRPRQFSIASSSKCSPRGSIYWLLSSTIKQAFPYHAQESQLPGYLAYSLALPYQFGSNLLHLNFLLRTSQ